jgi:hypothetical protein
MLFQEHRLKWEADHEGWESKDLEVEGSDLFSGLHGVVFS